MTGEDQTPMSSMERAAFEEGRKARREGRGIGLLHLQMWLKGWADEDSALMSEPRSLENLRAEVLQEQPMVRPFHGPLEEELLMHIDALTEHRRDLVQSLMSANAIWRKKVEARETDIRTCQADRRALRAALSAATRQTAGLRQALEEVAQELHEGEQQHWNSRRHEPLSYKDCIDSPCPRNKQALAATRLYGQASAVDGSLRQETSHEVKDAE